MEVQRPADCDINLLCEGGLAVFADLDAVVAGAQVDGAVLVASAGVGAVDEHLSVLHLGVELDLAGMGIVAVGIRAPIGSPIRPPEWRIPTAISHRPANEHPDGG